MTKIQNAIENRNWKQLNPKQLQKAEKQLRKEKSNDKGGLNIAAADKWVGIKKHMTKRNVDHLGELKWE